MVFAALGATAAFVAVTSFFAWAGGLRAPSAESRLRRLSPAGRPAPLDAPFADRVMLPVFDGVARFGMELLPHSFVARIQRQLVSAGRPMSVQAFFTIVLLFGGVVAGLGLFVAIGVGGAAGALIELVAIVMGVFLPFVWLRRRVRARQLTIWKSLADAFDLVTVSVEAGLGLDAALRHVSQKLRGPLADEIRQMLREVGMGRPRREALEEMAIRVDVKELETFVNAIIQAEQLGTSLGRVLRSQAATLRTRRRQRAEETSRKAPVKMVFPLVLCLMPSFFIVVIGPMFVRLVDFLND